MGKEKKKGSPDFDKITLCELDKDEIERSMEKIKNLVAHPRHICCKCARVANRSDLLCKPIAISPPEADPERS